VNFLTAFLKECAGEAKTNVTRFLQSRKARIDDHLPRGMRLGGIIGFDDMMFVAAMGAGHLIGDAPPAQQIVAYGRGELFGLRFHRFYLADTKHFVQAVVDSGNQLVDGELRLYRRVREWMPQNDSEWSTWLDGFDKDVRAKRQVIVKQLRKKGWTDDEKIWQEARRQVPEGVAIGYITFDLKKDEKDGKDSTTVLASYRRVWPSPEDETEQVDAEKFKEEVFTDPFDTTPRLVMRNQAMLYGRPLTGVDEYLYLTEREHGPESKPLEPVVEAYAGITITNGSQLQVSAAA
jgi:hypothetical protein